MSIFCFCTVISFGSAMCNIPDGNQAYLHPLPLHDVRDPRAPPNVHGCRSVLRRNHVTVVNTRRHHAVSRGPTAQIGNIENETVPGEGESFDPYSAPIFPLSY